MKIRTRFVGNIEGVRLTYTECMRQVALVDHQPRPLSMLLPPLNKGVPEVVGNPMVVLAKEEEELGQQSVSHADVPRSSSSGDRILPLDLPYFLVPLILADDAHLVEAHVQGLPDAVAALEPAGGDMGGGRGLAEHVGDDPEQGSVGPEPQEAPREQVSVALEQGPGFAEQLHALAARRVPDVLDGGEQQDARFQPEVRRRLGLAQELVKELEDQVGADGVAYQYHLVERLPPFRAALILDAILREGLEQVVHLVGHVAGRVRGAERLVVIVIKTSQVLSAKVEPGSLGGGRRVQQSP